MPRTIGYLHQPVSFCINKHSIHCDRVNLLAQETLQKIRQALETPKKNGAPEVISLVNELSSKAFSITIEELSNAILSRKTLTKKILKAAKTFAYNPNGVRIETIDEAIQIMGFKRVRNLALSLLLIDNAEDTLSNDEQRKSVGFALMTAEVSKQLLILNKSKLGLDAFYYTALRNYGRLLMTTFLIEDFQEAMDLSHQIGLDDAYLEIFGLSPLELGKHLLNTKNMHSMIQDAFTNLPKHVLEERDNSCEEQLSLAAEFSNQFCFLLADSTLDPTAFNNKTSELVSQYGNIVDLDNFSVEKLIQSSTKSVKRHLLEADIDLNEIKTHIIRCLFARNEGTWPLFDDKTNEEGKEQEDPQKVHEPESYLIKTRDALEQYLQNNPHPKLKTAYNMFRGALLNEFQLDECILFKKDGKNFSPLSDGYQHIEEELHFIPVIHESNCDIFTVVLKKKEDILIENVYESHISAFVPVWMRGREQVYSFFAFPLLTPSNEIVGITYGSSGAREAIHLNKEQLSIIRAIKKTLISIHEKTQD